MVAVAAVILTGFSLEKDFFEATDWNRLGVLQEELLIGVLDC